MNGKKLVVIVVSVVMALAYLFLPIVSVMGMSANGFDIIDTGFSTKPPGTLTAMLIVGGAALAILGALGVGRLLIFSGSIASAAGFVIIYLSLDSANQGFRLINTTDILGIGFWGGAAATILLFLIGLVYGSEQQKSTTPNSYNDQSY